MMSAFDNVKYKDKCHFCGEPLDDFQTKDGPCDYLMLKPVEVRSFYTDCRYCTTWHEYFTKRKITAKIIKLEGIRVKLSKPRMTVKIIKMKNKKHGVHTCFTEKVENGVLIRTEILFSDWMKLSEEEQYGAHNEGKLKLIPL
jgi:hypothetical protein